MKKLLVVVDFQNDFVTGALGFESATNLEKSIYNRIMEYKHNGDEVIFTMDTHTPDEFHNSIEGRAIKIEHCMENTEGWEVYGAVKALYDEEKAFKKSTYGSSELYDYLRKSDYLEVEFCGLVTNICVMCNVVLARVALPETQIIINSKLVDSYDKGLHQSTLDVLKSINIEVV